MNCVGEVVMKKKIVIVLLMLACLPNVVQAQRGCCSHHGGVAGCSSSGRQICRDGTLSPSCTCSASVSKSTKSVVYGCTDKNAINYNKKANTSNNSCQYEKQEKEIENISYEVEYKGERKNNNAQENVVQKGKNGKKEVTYKTIVDQSGNIISKEKVSESIVEEPLKEIIETSTIPLESFSTLKESEPSNQEQGNSIFGVWFVALLISFLYSRFHKEANLLLNKIPNFNNKTIRIILYVLYVVLFLPPFIDVFYTLFYFIKGKKPSNN